MTRRQFKMLHAGGGSAGGTHWIGFTIVDVFCPNDYDYDEDFGQGRIYVTATVDTYSVGCGKTPPGYDNATGTVRILDKCIFKYFTEPQLMGASSPDSSPLSGDAIWLYPFDDYSGCEGFWEVKSVCGEPTCGDSFSPPPDEGGGE